MQITREMVSKVCAWRVKHAKLILETQGPGDTNAKSKTPTNSFGMKSPDGVIWVQVRALSTPPVPSATHTHRGDHFIQTKTYRHVTIQKKHVHANYCILHPIVFHYFDHLRSTKIPLVTTAQRHQFPSHLGVQTTPWCPLPQLPGRKTCFCGEFAWVTSWPFLGPPGLKMEQKTHLKIALGSWKFKKLQQNNDSFGKGTLKSRTFILGSSCH